MYFLPRRCRPSLQLLRRAVPRGYAKKAEDSVARNLEDLANAVLGKIEKRVGEEVGGRSRTKRDTIQFTRGRPSDAAVEGQLLPRNGTAWDDSRTMIDLKPGDYVDLGNYSRKPIAAVVLGQYYSARDLYIVSFTESGNLHNHTPDSVRFSIPGLISSDLAARCGVGQLAETPHEQAARLKVLHYLSQLGPTVTKTAFHATNILHDAYQLLRHKDPDRQAETSLSHLTRVFKRKPTFVDLIAVNRVIADEPYNYRVDRTYLTTQIIHLLSLNEQTRFKTVSAWMDQPDSPVSGFIKKARAFLEEGLALQAASSHELPSVVQASQQWTSDEQTILKFLVDGYRAVSADTGQAYRVFMSSLTKRIMPDRELIDLSEVFELLTKIGVFVPWKDTSLHLTDTPPEVISFIDDMKKNKTVPKASTSNPTSQPLGPRDFHPRDPLEAVRHDFGDAPVYVIDESSAKELDDGFSIETAGDDIWVHVHIADPAAVIPPTNMLAGYAQKIHNTRYYPLRTQYMIPPDATAGISLGSVAGPQRVLTFSAKISPSGDIVDHQVRAGIINNIVKLTYDTTNELMGFRGPEEIYPFGDPLPLDIVEGVELSDRHRAELRLAVDIRERMVGRRFSDGVFVTDESKAMVKVKGYEDDNEAAYDGRLYRGYIPMHYMVRKTSDMDNGANGIVAEMMKIACRVSARYFTEHNIPALYRVLPRPVIHPGLDIDELLAMRSPAGFLSRVSAIPFLDYDLRSSYAVAPGPHWTLGVPGNEGYTRTTSPLRRFIDLQAHWQIHAELLGRKPVFSMEVMERSAETMAVQDRWLRRDSGKSMHAWQATYLKHHIERNGPLGDVDALVIGIPTKHSRRLTCTVPALVPSLGLKVTINELKSITEVKFGETVRLKDLKLTYGYFSSIAGILA